MSASDTSDSASSGGYQCGGRGGHEGFFTSNDNQDTPCPGGGRTRERSQISQVRTVALAAALAVNDAVLRSTPVLALPLFGHGRLIVLRAQA